MTPDENPDPYAVEAGASRPSASAGGGDVFDVAMRGDVHVITFSRSDVLDAYYIEQLGDGLVDYVKGQESPKLVVDMGKVNHLSSAALGMLVTLKTNVDAASGRLCLADIRHDLMQVFKLTKLNKILEIHEGVDGALSALG